MVISAVLSAGWLSPPSCLICLFRVEETAHYACGNTRKVYCWAPWRYIQDKGIPALSPAWLTLPLTIYLLPLWKGKVSLSCTLTSWCRQATLYLYTLDTNNSTPQLRLQQTINTTNSLYCACFDAKGTLWVTGVSPLLHCFCWNETSRQYESIQNNPVVNALEAGKITGSLQIPEIEFTLGSHSRRVAETNTSIGFSSMAEEGLGKGCEETKKELIEESHSHFIGVLSCLNIGSKGIILVIKMV